MLLLSSLVIDFPEHVLSVAFEGNMNALTREEA